MQASQVTYSKVTEQRGKKRLWLQGLRLSACGFDKGVRYRVDYDMDTGIMHVVLDSNGPRVVSGRKRSSGYEPIIDICNADVVRLTKDAARVRAVFFEGRIEFSISHTEENRRQRERRLLDEVAKGEITTGTVCAGIGMATQAMHEGFAAKGLKARAVWICDRERKYLEVACRNNTAVTPTTKIFEASLEELEPDLLGPVSVLQASLPCTGHSVAGRSKNKIKNAESHATDATAIWGLMKIVEAVQPACIVSENVILARASASYILLKGMLTLMGYRIHELELGPDMSGAFEARRRYWFIAVSKGLVELDVSTLPTFPRQYASLGELLEPIADDSAQWSENRYLKDKQLRDAAAGKGFAKRQLLTPAAQSIGVASRTYQKRQSTAPMLTRDDGKERLLTPLELCRAHGAPESLIKDTVDSTAYEGIGQGIDWMQAVGIGQLLAQHFRSPARMVLEDSDCCPAEAVVADDDAGDKAVAAGEQQYCLFA